MVDLKNTERPTPKEQSEAKSSYEHLVGIMRNLKAENPEVQIGKSRDKVKIPQKAFELLIEILKTTGEGKSISVVPVTAEMTTQTAAEYLGCSRPHVVKLLQEGEIPYTKVGKHRRVRFQDLQGFKKHKKAKQEKLLEEMMKADEDLGLYDP